MKIHDLIYFDKKKYFGGAVQANWFYDSAMVRDIVSSYVFHGPKYHGVNRGEDNKYSLYDTASYACELIKDGEREKREFMLTIASYGTGKSHLAVVLAALLSGHDEDLRCAVLERVKFVDLSIYQKMLNFKSKNLVILLNGMNNFNLDFEILNVAKKALYLHGVSEEVLHGVTKQYDLLKHFVESTYDGFEESYKRYFLNENIEHLCQKEKIISEIEHNSAVLK